MTKEKEALIPLLGMISMLFGPTIIVFSIVYFLELI